MSGSRIVVAGCLLGLFSAAPGFSQDYPYKPIRIVVSQPGGAADVPARIIAPDISSALGQPVVIENRGGIMAALIVSKALPDGYTLMVDGSSFWVSPLLEKMPFDPVRDYAPVSLLSMSPNVLVTHPSVPVTSVKDLIALAKARPGQLNYGSGSIGASPQLAAELFNTMAGVNIVRVSYKGGGPALTGLIGGEVQVMFATGATVTAYLKSGKLKVLAITSARPSALFPNIPTVAETLPGYDATTSQALFAPARTPATIINRLNREIGRALNTAEIKKKFADTGVEAVGSSPAETVAMVKTEVAKWGKILHEAK